MATDRVQRGLCGRRRVRWAIVACLVGAVGCDTFSGLRAFFRAEPEPTLAGLRVDVEPPDGLTILLDGLQVGSIAPYENVRLAPGRHLLEVRADGHHPFVLPVELVAGKTTRLSVALRVDASATAPQQQDAPGDLQSESSQAAAARVRGVALLLRPKPDVPVLLDGRVMRGDVVTLTRSGGELLVGVLRLTYRVGAAGFVELAIAEDGARWWKDGQQLGAGGAFAVGATPVRLRRVGGDGTDQSVVIRRRG